MEGDPWHRFDGGCVFSRWVGSPVWEARPGLSLPPPPPPDLTKVSPDRVAVGDLLVLEGRHFLAGEPQVVVRFGSIPVTVAPESGSRLSVLVPPGVRIPPDVCEAGGTLRIKRTPEPEDPISGWEGNPDVFTWIEGDGEGKAQARILFGQAPRLQAFWKPAGGGEETPETVKWEIVAGSETAPNADPKGLYPGKPAVFFTGGVNPYEHAELRFQTVHTGAFVLRATTKDTDHKGPDGRPATIEIAFTVAAPAGLRGRPATHDPKILQYADRYGIPPQYLKAQAFRESGLDSQAFRYEPRTVDKKYLSQYKDSDWLFSGWDLYRYRLPIDPAVSFIDPADLGPRRIYRVTEFQDTEPPAWPYTCHELGAESTYDPVTLFQIFEADDGWPCGTTPWKTYNPDAKDAQGNWKCGLETHVGPCEVRNGWWDAERPFNSDLETTVTYLHHTNTFYCGWIRSEPCAPTESESQWLLNHGDYVAQTVVASSYGLMQVLYTTAVQTQGWLAGNGRGAERHPARLFDPDVSLDLGASYDARQTACQLGDASWNLTSPEAFREAWIRGFGAYNTGKCTKRNDPYAEGILRTAASMWPMGGSTP